MENCFVPMRAVNKDMYIGYNDVTKFQWVELWTGLDWTPVCYALFYNTLFIHHVFINSVT